MEEAERKGLKGAYRKEKDPKVVARMLAVHMVYTCAKLGIDETAAHLMRSARWVRKWLHRYDERGLDDPLGSSPKQQVHADPAAERHHQTTHRCSIRQQSRQI